MSGNFHLSGGNPLGLLMTVLTLALVKAKMDFSGGYFLIQLWTSKLLLTLHWQYGGVTPQ
jgi:hypothetical protein